VPCTTSDHHGGLCFVTTGGAGYCAAAEVGDCFACRRDAECRPFCGTKAACIRCAGCTETGGTACVGTSR
jgi:hypothetical protein